MRQRIIIFVRTLELIFALIGAACVVMLIISTWFMPYLEHKKNEEDEDFDSDFYIDPSEFD